MIVTRGAALVMGVALVVSLVALRAELASGGRRRSVGLVARAAVVLALAAMALVVLVAVLT